MKETQSNAGIDSALQRGGRPQVKYTEEMILRSSSGYCMPFEEPTKQDVQMSLGYGEQEHPSRHRLLCEPLPAIGSGYGNRVSHRV